MTDKSLSMPVVLVPGFMSPAWMMWPMAKYLQGSFHRVVRWDYPRIFVDLEVSVTSLADQLSALDSPQIAIVTHSFGDWLTRSALQRIQSPRQIRLISLCPVTTNVPIVTLTSPLSQYITPELRIMSQAASAEVSLPNSLDIRRTVIHAKGDLLVRQQVADDQRFVVASHNSVLFQPNVWVLVRDELHKRAAGS
ncbi:Alpha/beta hydrolase family protein [Rubripirellula lacrimiformis]|uniref:Alpha/beta hydrolase family protein n=1 Tax=Rubripirellula lacrimiformis TaxID=1930273 RepID=A0A517N7U5_9BACT|nr:alpha/beta hydrolase [Rubripirellula lacrimiformis]QDT03078.1 Alpha/beta hydrolase family protein [Rubripirellula lacrimiformis]